MTTARKKVLLAGALAALLGAPLAGGLQRGLGEHFWRYPPLIVSRPEHAPFSTLIFGTFALLGIATLVLYARPAWFGFSQAPSPEIRPRKPAQFPAWGTLGLVLTALAWICAWGRFTWLGPLRRHMFPPLWMGYILVMDGLVYRRQGFSRLSRAPLKFAALFPASALSWWYFEYLNRFMRNWWYRGIEEFGPWHYVIYSTLCFSTVLPAIFETRDWLLTFPAFNRRFRKGPRLHPPRRAGLLAMLGGSAALYLLAAFPDAFFFATWLGPLAVLAGALALTNTSTPFHDLLKGDYTQLLVLAAAALITGFFWEMWNYHSLPQWNYSLPYVDRFHLFEMPLVGYTGYLPFGPLCWCFWLLWKNLAAPPSTISDGR